MAEPAIIFKIEMTAFEYTALSGVWRIAQLSVKQMAGELLEPDELTELRQILDQLDARPQDFLSLANKLALTGQEAGEHLLAKLIMNGLPTHGLVELLNRYKKPPES